MTSGWERRWHPLRSEWVTITSHRNQRPWSSGETTETEKATTIAFDPDCYLCPGNTRVSGEINEQYQSVFVFDNDHPAFSSNAPTELATPPGIYRNAPASGTTRVMCYSPDHTQSFAELGQAEFVEVLRVWADETESLQRRDDIEQVLIFENKGEVIGVSNPHPHCQIYAASFEFKNLELERLAMAKHTDQTGRSLMADIIAAESEAGRRVLVDGPESISFLPYFSRFPFETFICPRAQHNWLFELSQGELEDLATTLRETLVRFDNLWRQPFPYMLVLHQAPKNCASEYYCHIQIHPLMRQPTLQKFLAGVESGGGHFLNDVDPDGAAAQLRALDGKHYRH